MNADQQFESELETFRKECEEASQCFYGYLAIHQVAKDNRRVFGYLNKNALFWNTVTRALQTSALIALHRIFNHRSRHNIDSLLRIAEANICIFTKQALGRRKQGNNQKQPEWLNGYLRDAHEPTNVDFRRIRAHAEKYKQLYEVRYAPLRNKVYAHAVASDPSEIQPLVAKTNIREMKRIFVFLLKVHDALGQSYFNGHKLVLRAVPYSPERMRKSSSKRSPGGGVHVDIAREVEHVLLNAAAVETTVVRRRST